MIDVGSIVSGVAGGLDKLFTSDEERLQAQATLEKLKQQPHLMQAVINQAEAKNKNLFVAGWRPACGWICAGALAFEYVIRPIAVALGMDIPDINSGELMTLLLGMLGLGGMRTFDKLKGTTSTLGRLLPGPRDTNHKGQ